MKYRVKWMVPYNIDGTGELVERTTGAMEHGDAKMMHYLLISYTQVKEVEIVEVTS
jgi:hypothetical protein